MEISLFYHLLGIYSKKLALKIKHHTEELDSLLPFWIFYYFHKATQQETFLWVCNPMHTYCGASPIELNDIYFSLGKILKNEEKLSPSILKVSLICIYLFAAEMF